MVKANGSHLTTTLECRYSGGDADTMATCCCEFRQVSKILMLRDGATGALGGLEPPQPSGGFPPVGEFRHFCRW